MSDIAILVGTSPSTFSADDHAQMVQATVASATAFGELADAQVVIAADGVSPVYADLADDYEKALQQLAWWANAGDQAELVLASEWLHQARTLRLGLERISAPFVLVMEHDAPLLPVPINWAACCEVLERDELDVVRFLHESRWMPEWDHLLVGRYPDARPPYLAVAQWSQRPHLARTDWYKLMLDSYFSPRARCFVEDVMHAVLDYYWREGGEDGWSDFQVGVYADPEPTMQRSDHVDGRKGGALPEPFYDYPNGRQPVGAPRGTLIRRCFLCDEDYPPGLATLHGERYCHDSENAVELTHYELGLLAESQPERPCIAARCSHSAADHAPNGVCEVEGCDCRGFHP